MRTLVVDDEPLARDGLRLMLAAHPDLEIVGEAGNGREALRLFDQVRPELLLIDIQMPEMDGLELAAALPLDLGPEPAVIFVTAHDAYALRAFEVHALDYLLKPVDDRRLALALARARAHQQRTAGSPMGDRMLSALSTVTTTREPPRLPLRDRHSIVYVGLDEIDWIEAADYYVEIHVGDKTWLHRESLQRLEQMLGDAFVRIHRSRLVNRQRIRELRWDPKGEMSVVLATGVSLKVARSCRAKLQRT
jgi:two-component system LytT family response regulator